MSGCSNSGCNCGSSCSCGSDCKCGKMFPYITEQQTAAETFVMGFSPAKAFYEESEMGAGAENDGCKCGPDCSCNPCSCK